MIGVVNRYHHSGYIVNHLGNGTTFTRPGDTGSTVGTIGFDVAEVEDNVVFLLEFLDLHLGDVCIGIFRIIQGNVEALFFHLLDKQLAVIAAGIVITGLVADYNDINVFLFVDIQRHQMLGILNQRDTLIGDFLSQCTAFALFKDFQRFNRRYKRSIGLFGVQLHLCLQTENTCQRVIQPLQREDTVFDTFLHVVEVFFHITGEQEDIRAVCNRHRDSFASRNDFNKAAHTGCVGNDQAVESHLSAQQFIMQVSVKRTGQNILILYIRVIETGVRGQQDMCAHQCFDTVIDHALVYFTVAVIPVFHAQRVDGSEEVLVTTVNAVTGPVFDTGNQAAIPHTACNGTCKFQYMVRVGTERTDIGNRVERVIVDIDNRTEVPVGTDSSAFFRADQTGFVSKLRVAGCADFHLMAAGGTVHNHIACAAVEVTGNKHRDFIIFLESLDFFTDVFGNSAAQQKSAGLQVNFFQSLNRFFSRFICRAVKEEQLTDFIVQAHSFDRFFNPGDLFVVQIEGLSA